MFRLELDAITKRYPGVSANEGVSLRLRPGEIHAVLGENGAGKSTLMKILYGAVQPESGELRWNGKPLQLESPRAARSLGIAMVFQHFALFESLTAAENVCGCTAEKSWGSLECREKDSGSSWRCSPEKTRVPIAAPCTGTAEEPGEPHA